MRDIVNSSYNSATLPTKNKIVRMNSSGTVKTDYRSYRDFLGSYGSDKNSKDDQESVSSTDSGISSSYKLSESKSNNTSTSSLNSEINGNSSKTLQRSDSNPTAIRTGSFKNYLQSYNNKKFSSVKPNIASKQNLIKSELIIQVNDPLDLEQTNKLHTTTIKGDIQNKSEDKTDAALHISSRPPLGNHKEIKSNESQHVMKTMTNGNSHPKESEPALIIFPKPSSGNHHVVKVSTLQNLEPRQVIINTKNINSTPQEQNCSTPPPPPPFPPPHSISSTCPNDFIPPPPPPPLLNLNHHQQCKPTIEKKWGTVKVDGCLSTPQEKQLPVNDAAASLAKILTQHLLPRRKELERLEENNMNETSHGNDPEIKNQIQPQTQKCKTYVQVMPQLPIPPQNKKPPQLPRSPPPQLPQSPPPPIPNSNIPRKSSVPSSPVFSRQIKTENPVPRFPIFSPTMSRRFQTLNSSNDLKPRSSCPAMFPKQPQKGLDLQKSATNGESSLQKSTELPKLPQTVPSTAANGRNSPNSNGNVEYSTTTVVPVSDSEARVSKADPNVRKLVYNTYRGLLGAYNNKANDMIATLPRNMVREDKGISKQLESMALQGGLEKLNGRTNPNVEPE